MKISILTNFALLVVACANNVLAQTPQADVANIKIKVTGDVRQAATDARIDANPLLVNAFVDAASYQKAAFAGVYDSVPKDERIARLARYLVAKEKASVKTSPSDASIRNLGDFHWGYVARDINYALARLDAPNDASLLRVESFGVPYDFSIKGEKFKPGMAVVLPAMDMTATFEIGHKKASWTGNPTYGVVKVAAASTSRGCEIFVRSKPPEATVYFNDKKWYELTDTSSVRDAGTWDVLVRLQGYKDWRGRRHLGPGESWTIDALLTK